MGAPFKYAAGNTFNSWTLLSYAGNGKWSAQCLCGRVCEVFTCHLRKGKSTQCKTCGGISSRTAAHEFPAEHRSWNHMRQRCMNKNNDRYKDYGGRGIKVCPEWNSFTQFVLDMGKRPDGTTLDRENVNGDYCKDNCRWAIDAEQYDNRQSAITHNGETHSLKEWCRILGLVYGRTQTRMVRGWKFEDAIAVGKVQGRKGYRYSSKEAQNV